jgi:osmoprotectant transport system substrate-binding protein
MVVALLGACSSGGGDGGAVRSANITVASFDFDESRVLGELYTQAIAARGLRVERLVAAAPREVVQPALEQGLVDVVPEYTGTALEFLNKGAHEASADGDATYARLQAALAPRRLVALQPASAQDQNGIAVSKVTADRLGLASISDLQTRAGTLVFGGPPECPNRPLCLAGLRSTYGLRFKEFRSLDAAGPYTLGALRDGTIGAALVFTTTPALADGDVVLLTDDRQMQPAEHVVPVVRASSLARYPKLAPALDAVSAQLTTADLVDLNRAVERGEEPAAVAARWLRGHGLTH